MDPYAPGGAVRWTKSFYDMAQTVGSNLVGLEDLTGDHLNELAASVSDGGGFWRVAILDQRNGHEIASFPTGQTPLNGLAADKDSTGKQTLLFTDKYEVKLYLQQ